MPDLFMGAGAAAYVLLAGGLLILLVAVLGVLSGRAESVTATWRSFELRGKREKDPAE